MPAFAAPGMRSQGPDTSTTCSSGRFRSTSCRADSCFTGSGLRVGSDATRVGRGADLASGSGLGVLTGCGAAAGFGSGTGLGVGTGAAVWAGAATGTFAGVGATGAGGALCGALVAAGGTEAPAVGCVFAAGTM